MNSKQTFCTTRYSTQGPSFIQNQAAGHHDNQLQTNRKSREPEHLCINRKQEVVQRRPTITHRGLFTQENWCPDFCLADNSLWVTSCLTNQSAQYTWTGCRVPRVLRTINAT